MELCGVPAKIGEWKADQKQGPKDKPMIDNL